MFKIETKAVSDGYVAVAFDRDSGVEFTSHTRENAGLAVEEASGWVTWFQQFPRCDCIYYIIAVPETWPGPPSGFHGYFGLRAKIGRTNDVLRRLNELRTGTPEELIIHALEPGDAALEAKRHQQFASDRRQGEWFAVSPELGQHMLDTWSHYKVLPREHQVKMMELCERVERLRGIRKVFGGAPDMINPSLNERWGGKVLIDTTIMTEQELRGGRKPGR